MERELSPLIQSIWCFACFFYLSSITLFRLRKFYTMIFWKHVLGFWAAFFLLILYLYSSFIALTFLWLMHSFLLSYMQCLRFSFLSLIFYWWSLPLWFLLDFLLFFYFQNSWSLCSLYCFYFHFQALNIFKNFTVCVFLNFLKRFVKFLFKDFFHFHASSFKVLHCATAMLW